MVAHVAKRPVVCEPAVECLGVVEAELDGKAEPLVQSVGLGLQLLDGTFLDGTVGEASH